MSLNNLPYNLSESCIVTASAGSGKTHRLTTRLIELLLNKVKSENIIAQTFTRKAAGEIYGRVIVRLLDLCSDNPQDPSIKLDLPKGYALGILRGLVLKQDRLRVETIDSFFADLCKSYFIELGLPPNWEIADEKQSDTIRIQAIKTAISKVGLENFRVLLDFLFSNQVPNRILKPLISELKEFGTLLTTSSKESWGNLKLINANYSIQEIKKALEDLLDRSEEIQVNKKIWSTIRSMVNAIGTGDLSYIYKSDLIQKVNKEDYTYFNKPIPEPILDVFLNLCESLKHEITSNTNSRTISLLGILTAYQVEYDTRIKEQGKLSFSDISELVSLNVEDLESSDLFSRLGMSLEHIMLDEFQDTSPLQWRIIENLSKHILESSSAENSILIVGDAKQAIYGWRGGSAEVFNHLRKLAPHIKEETLDVNYRSNPGIVEFVNLVFSCLKDNEVLTSISAPIAKWMEEFHPHIAHRKSKDHVISVVSYPEIENEENIYRTVLEDIVGIQSSEPNATIAVLLRKNSEIDSFGAELRLHGIEYSSSTTSKLDSSYPVQLLISLVTLAGHPEDILSFEHLKNAKIDLESYFGFGLKDSAAASLHLRKQFLIEGFARTLSLFASLYLKTCSSELDRNILSLSISLALEFERKGLTNWAEWIDRISSTNIPSTNPSRLQLLSMHKAKGLEFDYVFLPSLEDPIWKSNFLKILKDEEDPFSSPKTIVKKPTEVEINLVPELSKLRDSWINTQVREALSLLYVSLTRSIKGTYIYLTPTERNVSEIKIPSLSDILRSALFYPEGVPAGAEIYQSYTKEAGDQAKEDVAPIRELETLEWSSNRGETDHRLKGAKLLRQKKIGSKDLKEGGNPQEVLEQIKQYESLTFGTLIHKCLESLTWLDTDDNLDEVVDNLISNNSLLKGNVKLREHVRVFLAKALSFKNIKSIFLEENYVHQSLEPRLLREANLQIENDLFNLSGTVDRLVLCEADGQVKEIYLYDFKTDAHIDADKYQGQIEHYKKLIQAHWGQNEGLVVKYSLVYLHSGEIIEC